jgi:hypothetical protein
LEHFFPFWYFVPRKIWQPCWEQFCDHVTAVKCFTAKTCPGTSFFLKKLDVSVETYGHAYVHLCTHLENTLISYLGYPYLHTCWTMSLYCVFMYRKIYMLSLSTVMSLLRQQCRSCYCSDRRIRPCSSLASEIRRQADSATTDQNAKRPEKIIFSLKNVTRLSLGCCGTKKTFLGSRSDAVVQKTLLGSHSDAVAQKKLSR